MKYSITLILLFTSFVLQTNLWGQTKSNPIVKESNVNQQRRLNPSMQLSNGVPPANRILPNHLNYNKLQALGGSVKHQVHLKVFRADDTGLPIMIKGSLKESKNEPNKRIEEKGMDYLEAVKAVLQIKDPSLEFLIRNIETDELMHTHIKMQQQYEGIKVYGAELILHAQDNAITLLNGRYFPTPKVSNLNPSIANDQAISIAKSDINTITTFRELNTLELDLIPQNQIESELVIYHDDEKLDGEKLAWHTTLIPHPVARWEYFVDAQTGEIIHKFNNVCNIDGASSICNHSHHNHHTNKEEKKILESGFESSTTMIDGPTVAQNVLDLNNNSHDINTYEAGGVFYMLDASRNSMFNPNQSSMPNEPVGVVWTIDAFNTSPSNNNFSYDHVTSSNNNWSDRKAVSAQVNGGLAFEYFKNVHNRTSINGQGGNIISLINVADEDGNPMDNAFWNGAAMFYGNGAQAFEPLAKALDVAGHEMSHGVVQSTANLTYQGESGALNESFADIFGAMIDREDWLMGEDVVNTSVFPSGALRSLSDPHNGGNQLGDRGFQPKHYDERFTGSQDNGGVHINSGIPNHAYYLFATASGMNREKAEVIFYRALTQYLTASSKFVDLRNAVIQATTDIHGANSNEVSVAQDAFSLVGIGEGSGEDYQQDAPTNPGSDFIVHTGSNFDNIHLTDDQGNSIVQSPPFSNSNPKSKPSVSDDGSKVVFIDDQGRIKLITIDWDANTVQEDFFEGNNPGTFWRNVAISKDGTKLALTTDDFDNGILVFDDITGNQQTFTLENPTTSDPNIPGSQISSTGDVLYPDVFEWDLTGEAIIYDAINQINNISGPDITYWDIGIVNVWNNSSNNFNNGQIFKLFNNLPEKSGVGNPTFSKNSPYIIAFDFIDTTETGVEYTLFGANTETGDLGIIFENSTLTYPSYSRLDDKIVFDAFNQSDERIIATIDIDDDKINSIPNSAIGIIGDARWGVWFSEGERLLVNTEDLILEENNLKIFPNPFNNNLNIAFELSQNSDTKIQVFDLLGKSVHSQQLQLGSGLHQETLEIAHLSSGTYFVHLTIGNKTTTSKVMKFK